VHASMIGKVEKAMRYAHEPDRVKVNRLELSFAGDNGPHAVSLDADQWRCDCPLFAKVGGCVHTLAVQKMLDPVLSEAQRETPLYHRVELREEVGASA
jgi:hypothetical protein